MKRTYLALFGFCGLLTGPVLLTGSAQAQTVSCTGIAAWSGNSVSYAVGALVTYSGVEYKCIQAHTSQAGWDPPAVPALWSQVGTCSTSASCTASPSAPTGLSASGTTSSGTTLSWSAVTPPSNCSITSYTIYKGGTSIGTTTSTSYSVTGLSASTTYSFTVAATDSNGTGSQSSAVSVTTSAASSCTTKPSAPSGLSASSTTSSGTKLSWSAVTAPSNCSITSYTVYKGGTSLGTTTSTSYSVTGLSASTTYSFTVAATDAAGTGSQSSALSVTTSAAASCTTKPSAPSGLSASGTSSSGTTLSWSAVSAPSNCTISGYTVYQGGTAIATVSSGTSYTVSGLAASTAYTFTVAAIDAAGTGSQSSSLSVTTSAASSGSGKGKMIGYWESWASLPLLTAATNYDVVAVAFATASGTDGQTQAWPATTESSTQIASDISTLHSQGKKVLISVGGANTYTIKLESSSDESAFVSSVESIVSTWNLDGLDLDIENNNLALNSGDTDINNPTTPSTIYMIQAISDLKSHFGSSFMITMAPQVADINCSGHPLGNDGAGLYWGSFIPLINKARANITYVMTQDYNASQMYEKDGVTVVNQGTPDFDVAMSDLLLSGYKIYGTGQQFSPINANQVVVGTPAVTAAAGSGYNTPTAIDQVVNYIKFGTSYGGSYKLSTTYPSLGGVMTWDCNYDYNAGDPMSGAVVADVHK